LYVGEKFVTRFRHEHLGPHVIDTLDNLATVCPLGHWSLCCRLATACRHQAGPTGLLPWRPSPHPAGLPASSTCTHRPRRPSPPAAAAPPLTCTVVRGAQGSNPRWIFTSKTSCSTPHQHPRAATTPTR
jgi:hypothetical protein